MTHKGTREVVISIIENIEPSERAADLIISLVRSEFEEADAGLGALLPKNARPERRTRKARGDSSPAPDAQLDPARWYSMAVVAQRTGYAQSSLFGMASAHPERLRSKKEGRWKVYLGEDILKLAAERANGGQGGAPADGGTA